MLKNGFHVARIVARQKVSPTVMMLTLETPTISTFEAGQWVDFCVPPHEWVGGFSMASSPSELPQMVLAVKKSNQAPSQWVHNSKSSEAVVHVRVGGTCVLDTTATSQPVVFCAGGIGISPLLSMYRYWSELQQSLSTNNSNHKNKPSASFLYSVSTQNELVFGDELIELTRRNNQSGRCAADLVLTLTQQEKWNDNKYVDEHNVQRTTGRQMVAFLNSQVDQTPNAAFYLCGPPAMLDEGVHLLDQRSISPLNIHYEKWW